MLQGFDLLVLGFFAFFNLATFAELEKTQRFADGGGGCV